MYLAIFADNRSGRVDDDRGIEIPCLAVLLDKLGVAQMKAEFQRACHVEQRLGFRSGHFAFEKCIHVGLIGHEPTREEGGKREFREDDKLAAT